ncbi:MAG: protein translocase subunit SecF, partial [Sedimenticolaceae bacterium]|nr:protein translocase subunit SecF [Sedimenticolaceae bacterium]
MNKRTLALLFSGIVLVIAVASLSLRSLNFGIDFTGGTLIEVGYSQDVDVEEIRGQLTEGGYGDALIQRFGTPRDILIRVAPQEEISNEKISNDIFALLEANTDNKPELRRVEFVGPQVGDELTEKGGLAMLYSLIAIL